MKINVTGIYSIIKKLEKTSSFLKQDMKIIIEKLANIGLEVAKTGFSKAIYDGINDVVVDDIKWVKKNKIEIVARGNAIAFIEFGTGITYSEEHPLAKEKGFIRGTFGKGKGKHSSWTYYGEVGTNGKIVRIDPEKGNVVRTKGNPPARAMFNASLEIRKKMLEILKEAFKK